MTPRLIKLPYEVLSYIIEYLSLEDVVNLSRTSKQLRFLEKEDKICKRVLEKKLPFCDEVIAARKARRGYASALRRIAKRHEAIATANPFSIAIVGFGDDFLYCHGSLCYILDDNLRVLDLHRSSDCEAIVSIPGLLRKFLLESEQENPGRFRVMYYNEHIVSCLYVSTSSDPVAYLITFNVQMGKILLAYELPCTDKIFVRHTSSYLYYGTHSEEDHHGHKKWLLRGYSFEKESWLEQRIFLSDLNGSDIGSTVCFEIHDGFFYALSNQTNHDIEEVDWTSFYHCVRFPVASPSKKSLENTAMDEKMWRRQHREGPLDDRWGSLALILDDASGELKIVETRKEFLFGASRSHRTYYTTKLVFPSRSDAKLDSLQNSAPRSTHSSIDAVLPFDESSPGWRNFEKHTLAALTNDRLALTLKPSDNPHWLPPQTRFPRNVHPGSDDYFILSQTFLRAYNYMAKSFLDVVDEQLPTYPPKQRLRLRAGSRKLDPPARDSHGILIRDPIDPLTGDVLYGLNERYSARPVAFWPADQDPLGAVDKRLEELDKLMNPPGYLGNVEIMEDERSFVYATGGKNKPRALIFVSFDPSIRLKNLRAWDKEKKVSCAKVFQEAVEEPMEDLRSRRGKGKEKEKEIQTSPTWDGQGERMVNATLPAVSPDYHCINSAEDERWISYVSAMYVDIDRGFDFGL